MVDVLCYFLLSFTYSNLIQQFKVEYLIDSMLLDKNSGGAETVESSAVLGCTRITYMSDKWQVHPYGIMQLLQSDE